MESYTIIVTVTARTQALAFGFVEDALDRMVSCATKREMPQSIHVATADGIHATAFDCEDGQ